MNNCIFCKIAKHEIPKEFVYEDEKIMVFPDIQPIKKTHLLIIPKRHIIDFQDLDDDVLLSNIKEIIQKMIISQKLENAGFRIVINGGGAQAIDHLHFHLTGPWGKAAAL